MAEFQYRVIGKDGKEKKGTVEGKNAKQVELSLKAEGYIILSVGEANLMTRDINISIGGSISARDYSVFCRQFVSIIGAGVSIIGALDMMAEQTENKQLKNGIKEVYNDVSKGESMAGAMRKRGKIFPSMLCNMVEAGEASGSLEISFERMALQFEKDAKLKAAVKKAMIYPIVLIFVMLGVLVIMLTWVVPTFMGMFAELEADLPASTKAVVAMSDFVKEKWWVLLLTAAGIIGLYKLYASTENGKLVIGSIKLKVPVFGMIQRKSSCARLGRTLGTLLGAGVSMIDALDITAKSMENVHYRKALENAKDQVSRGVPLSRPLKTCGLFPPMVIHMVSIGEETGNIETMLENIANYYEEDVQLATEQMMALMEPAIIIVMAVMVGFLMISIMQPMMVLYDSLGA